MTEAQEAVQWREIAVLVTILVAAAVLRTWHLGSVPPGLTHDEASNGHDAAAILRGVRPIYFTVGYGHEPLYPYSVALSMALLGSTDLALRLTTVAWGLCLILLSYLITRGLFGGWTALLTAAWMAVSFWCLMTSRVGLRAITSATTFTASAYAFWRAIQLPQPSHGGRKPDASSGLMVSRWLWWALAGLFLGASIYTYMASRAMPAVYVLFVAYLVVLHAVDRSRKREAAGVFKEPGGGWTASLFGTWQHQLIGIAVLLLVASIVAAPLVHFLMTHPEAEQRLEQLSGPINEALHGRFEGLWRHVSRSLPMFTLRGDPLWLYNIPDRPLLDVLGGAFFYAGLLVCLWRWRDPRYVFVLLWLVVGAAPALVTGPDATVLRAITAQPVVFIIAAIGLMTVLRFFHQRAGRWGRVMLFGVVVGVLALTGARTVHAYFEVWAQHSDVRVAYHHALVEQAHYLDAQRQDGTVTLSSIYPGRFHDPYTMEVTLRRDDLSLRWFDGRYSLIFPAAGESRVVIPSIAPLDQALSPLFTPHASLVHTEHFRPDDLVTRFDVYCFNAEDALAALMPNMGVAPVFWSSSETFPVGQPRSAYEPLALPVNLGGIVDLVGYDLQTSTVEPGGEIVLLTAWRVRDAFRSAQDGGFNAELIAFTHALDPDGAVVGQVDRLDVPSWHWQPGDAFVQLHRFPIESNLAPGLYPLEVGFYTREGFKRFPVTVDGDTIDDRILLRPVEVSDQ